MLKEIGIVNTNAPQDQLTDNEVIHSILLRGITTKTEEAGEQNSQYK